MGRIEISSSKFHIQPNGELIVNKVTAKEGTISTFTITSGSIDSDTSNSKRGLKLEPGKSIRGFGSTVHSTTTVGGKFSFGDSPVAPAAGASVKFSSDLATAPGGITT